VGRGGGAGSITVKQEQIQRAVVGIGSIVWESGGYEYDKVWNAKAGIGGEVGLGAGVGAGVEQEREQEWSRGKNRSGSRELKQGAVELEGHVCESKVYFSNIDQSKCFFIYHKYLLRFHLFFK
jgi:hypothetical protein